MPKQGRGRPKKPHTSLLQTKKYDPTNFSMRQPIKCIPMKQERKIPFFSPGELKAEEKSSFLDFLNEAAN